MNENVFDILVYLFENYADGEMDLGFDQELVKQELNSVGFPRSDIKKAFVWLEDLALSGGDNEQHPMPSDHSVRIYNAHELKKISTEARGFLCFLEQINVLNSYLRELVVERVMAFDGELDLEQLKWITLLVLFNHSAEDEALGMLEDLIYNQSINTLH
ncbi:MAG: DUF494 domain-containing protein [Gammaproteobacteria bacterium]|nr:DUF494 domain-containing protein [Gammaproteobacteria bacterium]